MASLLARPFAPSARATRASSVRVRAGIAEGATVKVVKAVKVFHVGKAPELNLEGLEGKVFKNVTDFKGKTLSANLPYQVAFELEKDGAKIKFKAHLDEDEIEVVA